MAVNQTRVENIAKKNFCPDCRFRAVACEANLLYSQPTCLNASIAR